ncbi:MAG TPA: transcription termination/antitermination NusG family protein [Gemmatimonadaceae bacterium]|nr:transcription termination/antitermination NusG family protein [Gemmatimonadaceae bacterium]
MSQSSDADQGLTWQLIYTKPRCEAWAEVNLRNQGFVVLGPRTRGRTSLVPLFPRYLFVGGQPAHPFERLRNTRGVAKVVYCGDYPARVEPDVIRQLRARMNANGVVTPDAPTRTGLFSGRERERVRALLKLAAAGYRVRSA